MTTEQKINPPQHQEQQPGIESQMTPATSVLRGGLSR